MTNCHLIVEELESSATNPGMLPISLATSVFRGLRRTLEEASGAIDIGESGPIVEEECPVQKHAREPGQVSYDEVIGLPLDPKLVVDAIKEKMMVMRKLQVYHEVPVRYLDKSGLKASGTRWVYTKKGDAANPFVRERLVAQEIKRVSKLTPEDASSTVAASPSTGKLQGHARCVTGKRRAPAEGKVLGFYDIRRAHLHSPARCTIVMKARSFGQSHVWNEGCCTVL